MTTQVTSSLLTLMAMAMTTSVIVVLGYTTAVLHKVHAHAGRAQLATPAGPGREGIPAPAAERPRHPDPATVGPQAAGGRQARRPRRKWVTRLRVAAVLAATVAAAWATGWSHHLAALAGDAAVLLAAAWTTRRWR